MSKIKLRMDEPVFNCKSKIIGHRGVKGDVMENTLESILYAIDLGVDGVEFDVFRCYTGEVVVFHDETVDRLAFKDQFYFNNTMNIPIGKLQWYHLYNTELIDSMGRRYKIPKLVDILRHPKLYSSDVLINIEIKDNRSHEVVGDIISELVDEGLYQADRFMISSSDLDVLTYFSEFKQDMRDEHYQNFKIGQIFWQELILGKDLLETVKNGLKVLTHVVLEKEMVNLSLINQIKELGLKIFVYTINTKSEYPIENIENLIDGIITDKPKLFL